MGDNKVLFIRAQRKPLTVSSYKITAMKLLFLLTTLLFTGLTAFSQLAIISDPDGYTNIREAKSITSRVIGRVNKEDVFLVAQDEENDDWWGIFFTSKAGYIQGFIHQTKFIELGKLRQISRTSRNRKSTDKSLSISNDSTDFSISLKPFNLNEHQVRRNKGYVDKIDGMNPWGVDGGLPKMEISSMVLKIKGQSVTIPKNAFKDLYEIGLKDMNIHFDNRGNIYIYFPLNSDGAGGYFGTWVIKDNKYKKRYIDTL